MPTIYRSTDTSAPVLTGQVGSLIALLDACLVNGYGSKSAAGWTKPFSGTDKAAYRMGAPSGMQFYLRVADDASAIAGAVEATVKMYDTMSDVDSGTNAMPPGFSTQVIRKSNTADATARPWVVAADERTVYIFIAWNGTNYTGVMFGEFYSFVPNDAWRVGAFPRAASSTSTVGGGLDNVAATTVTGTLTSFGVARSHSGSGGPIVAHFMRLQGSSNSFGGAFPNPADGLVYLGRHLIVADSSVRGFMRGFYETVHGGTGLANGDTFSGTGDFAGRTFEVIKPFASATLAYVIETSAWDTSS